MFNPCRSEGQLRKLAGVPAAAAVSFSAQSVVFQTQFFIFQILGKVQSGMQSCDNRSVHLFQGYVGQSNIPTLPLQDCGPCGTALSCRENEVLSSFYDFSGETEAQRVEPNICGRSKPQSLFLSTPAQCLKLAKISSACIASELLVTCLTVWQT